MCSLLLPLLFFTLTPQSFSTVVFTLNAHEQVSKRFHSYQNLSAHLMGMVQPDIEMKSSFAHPPFLMGGYIRISCPHNINTTVVFSKST